MSYVLRLNLEQVDVGELLDVIGSYPAFDEPPARLEYDDDEIPETSRWREILAGAEHASALWYGAGERTDTSAEIIVSYDSVSAVVPDAVRTFDDLRELLASIPFDRAHVGRMYEEGWCGLNDCTCASHGLGLALRGDGHDRLVSRRWLAGGPWRVVPGPDDLTFVQLHDLGVDAHDAWAQAREGYASLAIGLLDEYYDLVEPVTGTVDPERGVLEIEVPSGEVVSRSRMTDAAALRRRHGVCALTEHECDEAAFIFHEEADARAHLPELWRRELQCWVSDAAGRRRLDLAYDPPASSLPAWIATAESREREALAQRMASEAAQAVTMLDEVFGVTLDYSPASLALLDAQVERAAVELDVDDCVRLWGAYVGEVMRRAWGEARWQTVSDEWGVAAALVGPRLTVFPQSKLRKRFDNGREDELVGYFGAMAALR